VLFELDHDQQAIVDTVERILAAHAGPRRLRALGGDQPAYDWDLAEMLHDHGFPFRDGAGPLEAALVVEAVARAGGTLSAGVEALVGPGALPGLGLGRPAAIAIEATKAPVRFAADAATLIALGADDVVLVDLRPGDTDRTASRFGYPMATVHQWQGRRLETGSAPIVRAWWRLALALEICGTVRAALDLTVAHVREREQFGRPIGSFQAVQHRLAECEVLLEGSRWLALEAAWYRAETERAAAALAQALRAAERAFWDTHQFSGALGFAVEYDLHLWTMRLPALRAEALALGPPAPALAAERWGTR
jgi:alkylation response protein AidB-like acyl-CoA dehydrogenase